MIMTIIILAVLFANDLLPLWAFIILTGMACIGGVIKMLVFFAATSKD